MRTWVLVIVCIVSGALATLSDAERRLALTRVLL